MLHPFIPFVTEELWQQLPHHGETIMLAKYPNGVDGESYPEEEKQMTMLMEVIRSIRNIRAEMKVPMGKKAESSLLLIHSYAHKLERRKLIFFLWPRHLLSVLLRKVLPRIRPLKLM